MSKEQSIQILLTILIGAAAFGLSLVMFKHIRKRTTALHVRFLGQLVKVLIVLTCIFRIYTILNPDNDIHRLLLGSSALIVAVIGFASQPVIADLICGFLISINKPFELGDRIIIDGYEAGIVEDITLRHTVLQIYDGIRIIVPNSQLNSKVVYNTSYKKDTRSVHLQFSVSFDTDVQKAMDIIRDCVAASPYTQGVVRHNIDEDSGPVYFLKFADSAIILETTLQLSRVVSSYVATTDINLRVLKAFRQNNIEIPYNYINIIDKHVEAVQSVPAAEKTDKPQKQIQVSSSPRLRHFRTDTIHFSDSSDPVVSALHLAVIFAKRERIDNRSSSQIQLLVEESVNMFKDMLLQYNAGMYIEGSGQVCRIHIHIPIKVDFKQYHVLASLSDKVKDETKSGLYYKLQDVIYNGVKNLQQSKNKEFLWSIKDMGNKEKFSQEEISKSILLSISDDIRVTVTHYYTEIVLVKKFT
ncbi:mechanosensitive ion channel family protein [Oribacterium sp. C9]|uniref:mechanosensitive ion channel family protein n=1 Tax=Oribacterium sp. C9 TaxID=1943579 RepID=UPI00098F66D3|nr:mechanosensitive ion channel family protein [Oribacterium sp. C9]